jgi:hypothetical protein
LRGAQSTPVSRALSPVVTGDGKDDSTKPTRAVTICPGGGAVSHPLVDANNDQAVTMTSRRG